MKGIGFAANVKAVNEMIPSEKLQKLLDNADVVCYQGEDGTDIDFEGMAQELLTLRHEKDCMLSALNGLTLMFHNTIRRHVILGVEYEMCMKTITKAEALMK